jgi:8-oxo-dGTP diphosphatase
LTINLFLFLRMLKVTCAIIIHKNKILITQRGAGSDHPLQWEFPGGKIKQGESAEDCIKREIKEELDVGIEIILKMIPVVHDYGFKKIRLIPFLCSIKTGELKLNEHVDFNWVLTKEIEKINFSEADRKLSRQKQNRQILQKYIGEKIDNPG